MIKYLQLPTCKLAEFSPAGDTSFTVSGFLLNDGVTPVATTDIGDICYATLEPKTVREELISFTIASVTSAGVATVTAVRGLLQKSPYTTGGATFDHQNGTDFVISNNPGLFNQLTAKDNLEVITAQWSFPAPTANASPVTKSYADALVINGGAEATNTTRGVALLSASPDVTIGTATISIATPAVVSFVAHGLLAGDSIRFTTTGALPTGLVVGTRYFVMTAGLTANTFQVSLTITGVAINTSGTQSGIHTLIETTPIAVGFNDTTKLPTIDQKSYLNAITGMISMYGGAAAPTGFLLCNGQAVSRTTFASLFAVTSTSYGVGDGSTTFNVPNLASRFPLGYASAAPTKTFTFASRVANVITITGADNHAHNELQTGQAIFYDTTGSVITGLTDATTYYVIRVTATSFSLATSRANAVAGTIITLSSDGTGTQTFAITYTARPMGHTGGEEEHSLVTAEIPAHAHGIQAASGGAGNFSDPRNNVGVTNAYNNSDNGQPFMQDTGGSTAHTSMPLFTVVNYIIKT